MAVGQGAIRAGRAFVELFADDSKLVRALKRAKTQIRDFGKEIKNIGVKMLALGGAITAPLLAATKVFTSAGDQLDKMSLRTGVSVEALSELGYAAQLSGADMETLEKGVRNMQRTAVDAALGLSTATDALDILGLSVADLDHLAPEQQFKLIADRIAAIEDPAIKAGVAMKIFGKAGTQLLPLLDTGAAGIDALQTEFRDLGLTISTKSAKDAATLEDRFTTLFAVVKKVAFAVGAALAPPLIKVSDQLIKLSASTIKFVEANSGAIVSALKIGLVIAAVGAALVVVGTGFVAMSAVIGGVITVVTTLSSVLGAVLTVLGALLTPIGFVVGAIAGIGAAAVYSSGAIGKAFSFLADKFTGLADDAKKSFGAIGDALASGNIELAAKVLWSSLNLAWLEGTKELRAIWAEFSTWFKKSLVGIRGDVSGLFVVAISKIEQLAATVGSRFTNMWAEAVTATSKGFAEIFGLVKKAGALFHGALNPDFDATAATKSIDAFTKRLKLEIDKDAGQQEADRNRDRLKAISDIQDEQVAAIAAIDADTAQATKDLQNAYRNTITQNAADLQKARAEWEAAVAKARQEKDDAANTPSRADAALEKIKAFKLDLADISDQLGQTAAKTVGVAGTFNVSSTLALQAGPASTDAASRTANATAQTAARMTDVLNEMKRIRVVFGV